MNETLKVLPQDNPGNGLQVRMCGKSYLLKDIYKEYLLIAAGFVVRNRVNK